MSAVIGFGKDELIGESPEVEEDSGKILCLLLDSVAAAKPSQICSNAF